MSGVSIVSIVSTVSIIWRAQSLCSSHWGSSTSLRNLPPPSYFFISPAPPFLSLLLVPPPPSRAGRLDKEAIQCDIFCDNSSERFPFLPSATKKDFLFFKTRFLKLQVVVLDPQDDSGGVQTENLDRSNFNFIFFSNGKLGRLEFHGNFVAFVAERLTRSTLNCSEEEEAAIIFKLVFCLGP